MEHEAPHIPVLLKEVMEGLDLSKGDTVVDVTTGAGGHAKQIAEQIGPSGTLICLDRDPQALQIAKENLAGYQCTFKEATFDQLSEVLEELKIDKVDAILADLGVSSMQLDQADRGFSYNEDGPLKMTMNAEQEGNAQTLLANASQDELTRIFTEYGEENPKNARLVARTIVETRAHTALTSTHQLNDLLDQTLKASKKRPAIRIFQALRIAVNDELGQIQRFLPQATEALSPAGRLAIIAFHSLEDKIIKSYFQQLSRTHVEKDGNKYAITPEFEKPKKYMPTATELETNNRSRSSILRVIRKK